MGSSIVAEHTTSCTVDGTLTSQDYNIEDTNDCGLAMAQDLVDTDPGLAAAPADNDGPLLGAPLALRTLTRALADGSPALDSANPGECGGAPVDVDQRQVQRPQGPACDRGAFEQAPEPPPPPGGGGGGCTPGMDGNPALPAGLTRVEGLNRIQTAVATSTAVCGDQQAPAIVLSRADLFPDAQAGTPLAIELEAPLLLTAPTTLSAETEAEILRVLPAGRIVYLLGGTAALSDDVEQRLEDLGYQTIRYGGVDRFETATIIASDGLEDPGTILLTNGGVFADSVLAGTAASTFRNGVGAVDAAVLLTSGTDQSPFTTAYLAGRADAPDLIAIGAAAATAHPDADAVTGPTRFETAVAVAERFFPAPTVVGIARGDEFADALSGGALVGRPTIGPGPMLLVASDDLPDVAADWLAANAATITRALVFGGDAAVAPSVEAEVVTALGL